jgi:hypothetical protein
MDYNGTYEPSCYFSAIFRILLYAHAVQYGTYEPSRNSFNL